MQTIRRLYLYFIAAFSLTMLAVGLGNLLEVAFSQLWTALGGAGLVTSDGRSVREQVSLFTALVLPALPIWLLHWWLAQRAAGRPGEEGASERRSAVRALYLALALIVPVGVWFVAATTLLSTVIVLLTSPGLPNARYDLPGALAAFLVAGAIWLYHAWVRMGDQRSGPLTGAAAWLVRLAIYIATAIGAINLLFGATALLALLNELILGGGDYISGNGTWWAEPLGRGVAQVVVGALVWAGHWWWTQAQLGRSDWRGSDEQRSVLRRVYLYLIILFCVVISLTALSGSLDNVLRLLLGVPRAQDGLRQLKAIVEPLLGVLPFVLFWFFHRQRVVREAQHYAEAPGQATVRRIYTYIVSLVGLAFAAVGLALILGLLLDLALGSGSVIGRDSGLWWRGQVSQFGAVTLVGAGAWLWQWAAAQRWLVADPVAEQAATTRRFYLFAVLAASLVTLLGSLAFVIYRLFTVLLGVSTAAGLVSDISGVLGSVLVAGPLLAYHFAILRVDLAARGARVAAARSLTLVLSGPPEADLMAALADLRARLPEGYHLRPARGEEAPASSAPEARPAPTPAPTPSPAP